MKSVNFFVCVWISVIMLTLSNCASSKKITEQAAPSQNSSLGQEIIIPCVEASMDDDEFFRGLGTGTDVNLGNARSAALKSAESEIKAKLGGFVSGLSSDYSRTIAGKTGEGTERLIEGELYKAVERKLNDAQKVCDKTEKDQRGMLNSYIVLQIPKKELLSEMENSLTSQEELKIEFDREQFRKFAEEKMRSMKENKENK